MRIGFTGTQKGMTRAQRSVLTSLLIIHDGEFHHGDCVGADAQAHDYAKGFGYTTVIHPPIKPAKRAFKDGDHVLPHKDYLDRNKDIVRAADMLIAAPAQMRDELRSGTWSTVRYARKLGRVVHVILPDGTLQVQPACAA